MNPNEAILTTFYTAFQNKDVKGMQGYYSDQATFNDPAFKNLNAKQVRAMWEMLITGSKDMKVTFRNIVADEHSGKAHWEATYTFSATGRKVINKIDAVFTFKDGKILEHKDHFNFHTWARQALGLTGLLLGWTSFLAHKVQKQASTKLAAYIAKTGVKA